MFAALGVRVTIIDKRHRLLPFVDSEIVDMLAHHLREDRVTLRLGEEVSGMELTTDANGDRVRIHLGSGKQVVTDCALYSIGRTGATAALNLPAAGLAVDDRGRLPVNANYQTNVPNIYAVGDVIGFPSLASASMEQGRLAACRNLWHELPGYARAGMVVRLPTGAVLMALACLDLFAGFKRSGWL
jgi:NAD(P) transhydrogenase